MRKYIVLFALAIFFAGISFYLFNHLNPFDETQIAQLVHSEGIKVHEEFEEVVIELMQKGLISEFLNIRNVLLLTTTIMMSAISGLMLVHLIIDRVLWRKFYEQPSLTVAFRRAAFGTLGILSIFVYKLFAAEWYLTLLTLGLLLIVELVITRMSARQLTDAEVQELSQSLAETASSETESPPGPGFRLKIPHIREWPSRFRQQVMDQIAESQSGDTPAQ